MWPSIKPLTRSATCCVIRYKKYDLRIDDVFRIVLLLMNVISAVLYLPRDQTIIFDGAIGISCLFPSRLRKQEEGLSNRRHLTEIKVQYNCKQSVANIKF